MKIRKAKISDSQEIYDLLNFNYELKDSNEKEDYPLQWIKKAINSKEILFLTAMDKDINGILIAYILKTVGEAYLNTLYVRPEYRKKGVGKRLLEEYEKFIKKNKISYSELFVNSKNVPAKKFWESQKYEKGYEFVFYAREVK